MKTALKHIASIAIATLMLGGCTSSQYLKKGTELEAAGMYEQAANAYIVSLSANRNNTQSMIGLKNTGQRAIDEMSAQVVNASRQRDDRGAVYRYHEVDQMASKASKLGVSLQIPASTKVAYEESKRNYSEQLNTQAQKMLEANKFSQAETILKELRSINPAYDGVDDMLIYSRAEPLYQSALALYDRGKYRQAYSAFNSLNKSFPDYKDALSLRDEAFQRAQFTVWVEPFACQYDASAYAAALREHTVAAIAGLNHAFIKAIDPQTTSQNIQQRMRSQQPGMNVNQLIGAKGLVQGTITDFMIEPEHTTREMRKGYLRHEHKKRDKATGQETTIVEYEKVTYEVCTMSAGAIVTLKYQLVAADNGALLLNDVAHAERRALLSYVNFKGDHKKLVPGHWISATRDSDKDYISTDSKEIRALQRLCTEKRGIPTANALLEEAAVEIASRVAHRISLYNPE